MKFANLAAAIILICAASFPLNAGDKETYGNPDLMVNVYGRDFQLLNGKWDAIIDLYDQGRGKKVWENRKPAKADANGLSVQVLWAYETQKDREANAIVSMCLYI